MRLHRLFSWTFSLAVAASEKLLKNLTLNHRARGYTLRIIRTQKSGMGRAPERQLECSRIQKNYLQEEISSTLTRAHHKPAQHRVLRYQKSPSRSLHRLVKFKATSDSDGSRHFSDDYFPLGEEYEDELGPGWSNQVERIPAQKSSNDNAPHLSQSDKNRGYFMSASPLASGKQNVIFGNFTRECGRKTVADFRVRNMSDNETYEKLQALQKKVEEFKRKLFRLRSDGPETKQLDSSSPTTQEQEKGGSKSTSTTGEQNFGEPGDVFISSTQQNESKVLGGGSNHRFLTLRDTGRSGEAAKDHLLFSRLAPRRDTPRRFYGKCGSGSKGPKDPPPPGCSAPKKTPECPSQKIPPAESCPPSKVRFRECPPPPKLPKLPKCPPPCAPPPAPPVPKCPALPKCPPPCAPPQNSPKGPTSPPCPPPKQKCSHRQMSTYALIQRDCQSKDGISVSSLFRQSGPVFSVARRRVSSSSAYFASSCKSGKNGDNHSRKGCQKGKETQNNCSKKKKKSAADGCARSKKRDAKGTNDCRKPKPADCPTGCAPKPRCPPIPSPPRSKARVEWTPPICPPPRLVGPPPCPELSKQAGQGKSETLGSACPPPPPLPKPPCRPVCLCPCPPPPKLPPGTCPDVPTAEERDDSSCPPPCPPKIPIPCPKDTWCPSKPICPSKK